MPESKCKLISPYGGRLVDLAVTEAERVKCIEYSGELESLTLSERAICDLEMLATGAFSPLDGFMNSADYAAVLQTMRLADGTLFPVPITLPVDTRYAVGQAIALRDGFGNLLAIMTVDEVYEWDKRQFALKVLGTDDRNHPLVSELSRWGRYNIAGDLRVVALPDHRDFITLRQTPVQVRQLLDRIGSESVVAFQTRNPLHRAHESLTKRALEDVGGVLLLQPVVGMTKPGDVDHVTRVRCYQALVDNYYEHDRTVLSLLPLAMRMAGPREALLHAIIRRNYGATHFIVGRDHAGPGKDSRGSDIYGPYEAQELAKSFEAELGITILTYDEMVYVPKYDTYLERREVLDIEDTVRLSGTEIRESYLLQGRPLPPWFTRPEVATILQEACTPKHSRGFCLWFTGLSGSGKTTIAQAVEAALNEFGRKTTLLDGDIVRENLSKGLGFTRADREINISRVAYVAAQVVAHEGIAICALISPYEEARTKARSYFEVGRFVEIYVSTPIDVCMERDPKGHYVKARQGLLSSFTGIDDDYEAPINPDITIDTSRVGIAEASGIIMAELQRRGYLSSNRRVES